MLSSCTRASISNCQKSDLKPDGSRNCSPLTRSSYHAGSDFERLRATYSRVASPDEARAVVQLIEARLGQAEQSGTAVPNEVSLRVELAQLHAGPLAERARAKQELRKVLLLAPNQAAALYTLGKLHADDREWSDAVEPLGRYSELEQRPAQQLAVHLLLGEIYAEHLKEAQQAVAQYTRVLQIQPQNLLALGKLADLFTAQGQQQGALPLLKRLVKYTDDKPKKIGLYKRIAALSEEAGDKRGALEALRAAVDLDPMALLAIGELARYYERQADDQSLRLHLDLSASRFRQLLRERPRDPAIYQGLLQIFVWRKSSELAAMAAGALTALGTVAIAIVQIWGRPAIERLSDMGVFQHRTVHGTSPSSFGPSP